MKVKVRVIAPPYTDVPTESLQAILYNHAHNKLLVRIGTNQLLDIMGVLADRRVASGCRIKTAEEALEAFYQHYLPFHLSSLDAHDRCLVELCDVLPASLYAPQALNKKK